MRKFLYTYILIVSLFVSCSNDDGVEIQEVGDAEQTTIMYFMGTSLYSYYNSNVSDVAAAVADGALGDNGRLFIFWPSYTGAVLYEFYEDKGVCQREIVESFSSKESLDQDRILEVITKVKNYSPSNQYNLIVSGHGGGWVYSSHPYLKSVGSSYVNWERDENAMMTRFMGSSSDGFLEIPEFKETLESIGITYGYILFDMCFMSNIETLYDLKDLCDNIVASPCEVMGEGFPYQTVIPQLFTDNGTSSDFSAVCQSYYENYANKSSYGSAAVAWCITSELDDLADAMKQINEAGVDDVDIDDLQCYEKLTNNVFCDLGHYVSKACSDASLVDEFTATMLRAFPLEGRYHTESFYTALSDSYGWVDIDYYTGVSTSTPSKMFRDEWAETSWALDTVVSATTE